MKMKTLYLFIAMISLSFISCSSIYTIKDFPSKDKFYENLNNSVSNKYANVTLNNDSSFVIAEGAKISNDTLYFFTQKSNVNTDIMPVSKIKNISLKNNWLGVPIPLITGGVTAGALGYLIIQIFNLSDKIGSGGSGLYILEGTITAGAIIGGIIGWLNGYTYTYQFNPLL
jgi:hypothetical protein